MDLIKEMLPPEQAAMFDTYNTMFQNMDFMDMGMGQALSQNQNNNS